MPEPVLRLNAPFVLASRSPRRRDLLRLLALDPVIDPSDVDEVVIPGEAPEAMVVRLAAEKANDVSLRHPGALVLGADTTVVLEDGILGKPSDPAEASAMLQRLSGATHTVFTGVALVYNGRTCAHSTATQVTFGVLADQEIARYVAGGSPMDKAGAYGIQDDTGALFVDRIDGDYYNVVGLPLRTMYLMMCSDFADLLI